MLYRAERWGVYAVVGVLCTASSAAGDGLLWWSRLGNEAEVLNPEVGPAPIIDGRVSFVPGVFGQAYASVGHGYHSDRIVFDPGVLRLPIEAGTIEAWVQYPRDPMVSAFNYSMFSMVDGGYQNQMGRQVEMVMGDGVTGSLYTMSVAVRFGVQVDFFIPNFDALIGPGEWHHYAVVWDRHKIDGSADAVRLYLDGAVVGSTTDNQWGTTPDTNSRHTIGKGEGFADGTPAYIIDNIKVWDHAALHAIENRHDEDWAGAPPEPALLLEPRDGCLDASTDELVVDVVMTASQVEVVGGQFLIGYDTALLDLVSADPGEDPFLDELHESVDEAAGTIVYATGVVGGSGGVTAETVVARLTFEAVGEFCSSEPVVWWRGPGVGEQATTLAGAGGEALEPETTDAGPVSNDDTPPSMTVPSDVSAPADAGTCEAVLTFEIPEVTDNCADPMDIFLEGERSDGLTFADPYPAGITEIVWTATDPCGNTAEGVQTIEVRPVNVVEALVELSGPVAPGPFQRCITFKLYPEGGGVPAVRETEVEFVDGLGTALFEVPCAASYGCITACDSLHTLVRMDEDDFCTLGQCFFADFTSTGSLHDDSLVGGEANHDGVVDVLDFAIYIVRYGQTVDPDTPCAEMGAGLGMLGAPMPEQDADGTFGHDAVFPELEILVGQRPAHPDFNADGVIDDLDNAFIQSNWFMVNESHCGPLTLGPALAPRGSITVDELRGLGLIELAWADLDGDGVVDGADCAAFAAGVRPFHRADLDGDLDVDLADMRILVDGVGGDDAALDLDGDGVVGAGDLELLANAFGATLE